MEHNMEQNMEQDSEQNIEKCCYYNVGYCKNKTECPYYHPEIECEEKCSSRLCMKRHKKCHDGIECYNNHFKHCEFKHDYENIDNIGIKINYKKENRNLVTRLNEMNAIIENNEFKISEIEDKYKEMIKINETRIKELEQKIIDMQQRNEQNKEKEENKKQNMEENDKIMDKIYGKMSSSYIKFIKISIKNAIQIDSLKLSSEYINGLKINIYQCIKCNKTIKNDKAITIHFNDKHTFHCTRYDCGKLYSTDEDLSSHIFKEHMNY